MSFIPMSFTNLWRIRKNAAMKQSLELLALRVKSFHSPLSWFFCSSNRSLMIPTRTGEVSACGMVNRLLLTVMHLTSCNVKA